MQTAAPKPCAVAGGASVIWLPIKTKIATHQNVMNLFVAPIISIFAQSDCTSRTPLEPGGRWLLKTIAK